MAASSISLLLLLVLPLRAGIYTSIDTIEETQQYGLTLNRFRDVLKEWKLVGLSDEKFDDYRNQLKWDTGLDVKESPVRKRYLLMDAVGAQSVPKLRTVEQQLNYSAVLIRRGKPERAKEILDGLCNDDPQNFIAHAQLAIALFVAKDYPAARDSQREALTAWPERYADVGKEQQKLLTALGFDDEETYNRFRRIESHLFRLISLRVAEERKRAKKLPVPDAIDLIFGEADNPVRFVGDSGKFEVGKITAADFKRLPKDAIEIVKQLLIWLPGEERRLMWLLGEVYNASAMGFREADDRNDAIRDAYSVFKGMTAQVKKGEPYYGKKEIEERAALLGEVEKGLPRRQLPIEKKEFVLPPEEERSTLSDAQFWRMLIVSFITGVAVGVFALWQVQEFRRRRQARAAS